jgi:hypothetical protein
MEGLLLNYMCMAGFHDFSQHSENNMCMANIFTTFIKFTWCHRIEAGCNRPDLILVRPARSLQSLGHLEDHLVPFLCQHLLLSLLETRLSNPRQVGPEETRASLRRDFVRLPEDGLRSEELGNDVAIIDCHRADVLEKEERLELFL